MNLQYISDSQGCHIAVIIPIEEWNKITARHADLKISESSKKKPSDFIGSISRETAQQMLKDVDKSREEWERII